MLSKLAYYYVGDFSLIMISGFFTFILMVAVMMIPWLRQKGWAIKFHWHPYLAWSVLTFAVIHFILALSIKFGW